MAVTPTTPLMPRPAKADPELIGLTRQLVEGQASGIVVNDEMLFEAYFGAAIQAALTPDGAVFTLELAAEQAAQMLAIHRARYPKP